jgi:CO/xanthine dehydrogenase FAD-binding subunit
VERVDLVLRSEIDVLTPQSIDEALEILHRNETGVRIIAGGSDVIVQLRDGVLKTDKLLNIVSLKELRFIRHVDNRIHIGALSTYSDIIHNDVIRKQGWVLVEAAKQIGAIQLQNTATIGGNLGNASPAGDSLPPLYALDATVVTRKKSGKTEIPIEEFFVGYRKTALRQDELIEEAYFDALNPDDRAAYVKMGLREANAISIVDVAVVLRGRSPDNSFRKIRVALGAVAPTIRRASRCEQELVNKPLTLERIEEASPLALNDATPIDDIRGSAEYRKALLVSLVFQALNKAAFGMMRPDE